MALTVEELLKRLSEARNGLGPFPESTDELINTLKIFEDLLSQAEQSPSQTVKDSLLPTTTALIADNLLKHTDMDIKTLVVVCITEILRIFAPNAPFSDDQMRDVFRATILVLDQLSWGSGRNFNKAVSVLDVVTKIRSALILLDLECDALVVEMFNQFFRNIRSDHPVSVFPSMASTMALVINESDSISLELLSTLLSSVRKENQETSPLSLKLGEKVLTGCGLKLKRYIVKAVRKGRINLNDYTEIVNSLYQEGSNGPEDFKQNAEMNAAAGDGGVAKTDEKTEQPEGSIGAESSENNKGINENLPANVPHGLLVIHSKQVLSEVAVEEKPKVESDSVPQRTEGEGHLKRAIDRSETESDSVSREISAKPKPLENSNELTLAKAEPKAALELNIPLVFKAGKADNDTESSSSRGRGRSKRSSMKSPELGRSANPRLRVTPRALVIKADNNVEVISVTQKRGRRPNSLMKPDEGYDPSWVSPGRKTPRPVSRRSNGNVTKPAVIVGSEVDSASLNPTDATTDPRRCRQRSKASMPSQEKTPNSLVFSVKKESEEVADLAQQQPRARRSYTKHSGIAAKRNKENAPKEGEVKLAVKLEAVEIGESSSGRRSSIRRRKMTDSGNENSSSAKRSKGKTASEVADVGFELVGRCIMVWWPLDKTFYDGIVDSYDAVTKKHLVLYSDGDQEVLNLKRQHWQLLGSDPLSTQVRKTEPVELADSSPIIRPVENKRYTKSNQKRQAKEEKSGSSLQRVSGSLMITRSAGGKQAKSSNQVNDVKVTPSSTRSQLKRNWKGKAVEENKEKINAEVKQERDDYETGTEIQPNAANLRKEAGSSLPRSEIMPGVVESNVKFGTEGCANKLIELSEGKDGPKNKKNPKLNSKKVGGPTNTKAKK